MVRDSNWDEVIGKKGQRTNALWIIRIGFPNALKLIQGITVVLVSFVIIVQASDIIDLLKDFTALMIFSEFDNILFQLASFGYLGETMRLEAFMIDDANELVSTNISKKKKGRGLFFVRMVFFFFLAAMYIAFGFIFVNQRNGIYFSQKYPECGDNYVLALEHFGDGKCYGGPLNSLGCKFEGGNCVNFLLAYPVCRGEGLEGLVNVEDEVSNGICNFDFAIPECDYDGGDCCSYDIQRSPIFRNGQCNGGEIGSKGCEYDGGDCRDFVTMYPSCPLAGGDDYIILGNNGCGGGVLATEECGYENGDCDVGQLGGDLPLDGVVDTNNRVFFSMKSSADGLSLLVGMPHTSKYGYFNVNSPGRVIGFRYDPAIMSANGIFDRMGADDGDVFGTTVAMNAQSSVVAIGSPSRGKQSGRVDVLRSSLP